MESGIYAIENTETGEIYIGQSHNITTRWGHHKRTLRTNEHHNVPLQAAWNKYGESVFEFKVLELCEAYELDVCETHYIDAYVKQGNCYNMTKNIMSTRYGNGKVTRFEKAEMLAMLNEHKTLEAVAQLIGADVSSVSRYCADRGIEKRITWKAPRLTSNRK